MIYCFDEFYIYYKSIIMKIELSTPKWKLNSSHEVKINENERNNYQHIDESNLIDLFEHWSFNPTLFIDHKHLAN